MDDTTKDADVTPTMKLMHRRLGRAQRPAKPITKLFLDKMIEAHNESQRCLIDKILLLMGYEIVRQRAELVGFEFGDLTCLLNANPALRLMFSKAEQYGEGRLIGISKD